MVYARKLNFQGQSLLEITITIGLAVMVITALAVVTVKGLGASQSARLQAEASKYAQQGIDIVRGIRDEAGTACIGGSPVAWDGSFWSSVNCTAGRVCYFKVVNTSGTCGGTTLSAPYLDEILINQFETIDAVFSRQIVIEAGSSSCQRLVTSTVKWSDSAGTHRSVVSTILAEIPCP